MSIQRDSEKVSGSLKTQRIKNVIFHCFVVAKLDFLQGVFKKTLVTAGAAVERPRIGE